MQYEITQAGPLLDENGRPAQIGWSRQPLLDCNLERARFYPLGLLQRFRKKRWNYYAVFTPHRCFSATIADLGYAANLFVYSLDFEKGGLHEEGLVAPLGRNTTLERNSPEGEASYASAKVSLRFTADPDERRVRVDWPGFHDGRGINADIRLAVPPGHESMTIVIPIGDQRFYYNTKINCLPATGQIRYGDDLEELRPDSSLGQLDWGRGVWEYSSFWNWASASGFLPDGRTIGLNLGRGFGDLSRATENAVILDGRVHKLGDVTFDYRSGDFMRPWHFTDEAQRLDLTFTPFKDRTARTNLGVIFSEVHQIFGRYNGRVVLDDVTVLELSLIHISEPTRPY